MIIALGIIAIFFFCFVAAFFDALIEQHRQEIISRRMHRESEKWVEEHGIIDGRKS
jgi:hypothetical protein